MAKTKTMVRKEVGNQIQPQGNNHQDTLIRRVYLEKVTGLKILEGPDAEADIKEIQRISAGDDSPYTFYEEDGTPVYMAIQNGRYGPLVFPEPGTDKGQAGMTSMELYSKAVTLGSAVEKIIELETQPKPSLIDQAKKIMTPTIAIVACVLAIFLMLALMKG